ncbi:hypothetical protein HQQ80_07315 [Microbacteriaceae bacterium VKM Ac-2855]|nr:hypothetical protein [Microbacteriaceae bacterium VKM Ac-2855]
MLASVTPVLAAGVIWAITKSPYVLAFAALGPVIAIAGYLDGLRTRRRDARRAEGAHNELNGKDVDQIRSYAGSITKNERFNRPNVRWEFWLVGHTDHDHVVDNVSR